MKKNNTYQFFMTKGLLIIILLAFVIRMVFFVSLQPWDNVVTNNIVSVGDARGYHQLALSLLDNKSFENFGAFRTPGYPVFVAMIYSITWRSVWFVLLVQILLNVVSVVIIFRIAQSIFSRTVA